MKIAVPLLACLALLFWAVHEGGRASDLETALKASQRDATHQRQKDQAAFAQRLVEAEGKRDTVIRRISAVPRSDTIRLTDTVAVKVYIAAADSALKACSAYVASCEELQASAKLTIASLETERDAWKRLYEKTHKPRCTAKCGFVVGVVATVVSAVALKKVQDVLAVNGGFSRP